MNPDLIRNSYLGLNCLTKRRLKHFSKRHYSCCDWRFDTEALEGHFYLLLTTYYLLLITYYLSLITYYLLLIISFITHITAGNSKYTFPVIAVAVVVVVVVVVVAVYL